MIKPGAQAEFVKSSHCANATCVEVRSPEPTAVQVIDSKHTAGTSPVLSVSPAAFTALVESARTV